MLRKTKAARKAKPAEPPITFKTGRRLAIGDKEQATKLLRGLGEIQASWKECAAVLGISEATMHRMFVRWPDVKDVFDSAKLAGCVGLRRDQFASAHKGNSTMQIFLGMNYLGQRDFRNMQHSGEVKHSHQHTVIGQMLKEIDAEARGAPLVIEHDSGEKAA